MRTYKIPAIGLEIMGSDLMTNTQRRKYHTELKAGGWKIPDRKQMSLIWELGQLGVAGLKTGPMDYYWAFDVKGSGFVPDRPWNEGGPNQNIRLVREL